MLSICALIIFFGVSGTEISSHYCTGDHRDQKTLDRLRAERQAKIDELKERTNYYSTQQLIQVMKTKSLLHWSINHHKSCWDPLVLSFRRLGNFLLLLKG